MILYRARTTASAPRRHAAFEGNTPGIRVRGRWFTSCLAAAISHRETLTGDTEIVMVDVPDHVVADYSVRRTPRTVCGIDALAHSSDPLHDHILPMFLVMEAEAVAIAGRDRIRDYIDVVAPARPRPTLIVDAPAQLRMAA